jgi:CheY-like chemotaxis protein
MASEDILKGKKILAVDDEPDILETLQEILEDCDVEEATSFDSAKELLESRVYDAAILDIMGVRGFDLLETAIEKKIPALMLTAHGLNPDKGIEKSGNWFARLSAFFDERFGHGWKNKEKKFWQEFDQTYQVSKDELEEIM